MTIAAFSAHRKPVRECPAPRSGGNRACQADDCVRGEGEGTRRPQTQGQREDAGNGTLEEKALKPPRDSPGSVAPKSRPHSESRRGPGRLPRSAAEVSESLTDELDGNGSTSGGLERARLRFPGGARRFGVF